MAKRRAAEHSGSDVESYHHTSTPAKRVRVENDSEEDVSPPRKHVNGAKGKTKVAASIQDDEEEDEAELDARLNANLSRIASDQDDEEFEARNEAKIRRAMEKRDKKKGVSMTFS